MSKRCILVGCIDIGHSPERLSSVAIDSLSESDRKNQIPLDRKQLGPPSCWPRFTRPPVLSSRGSAATHSACVERSAPSHQCTSAEVVKGCRDNLRASSSRRG